MKLKEKLLELIRDRKAILAVNFYNFETLSGILRAAAKENQPIILQISESTIRYLGLKIAVSLARTALADYGVTGWLHLDHGSSPEIVRQCLETGFDSVMIDASEKPFGENVRITRQVVEMASKYEANVEAELGYVAKLGQSQSNSMFTQATDAARFVELTGVNALAVAIGSAHGFYKSAPALQIGLLKEIRQATPAALVLHGSSGIPDEMLREAINAGINKVNLATETKNIFMKTLKKELQQTDEIDLRKVFPVAIGAVTDLISQKIQIVYKSSIEI
jgi:fructose-bisphosphate aldolase class II/tagatose 1,6-diphosphate aldolase GatY/KbaY